MWGFWFLIDSSTMLMMELVNSKARSTRLSGLILRNRLFRELEGEALYGIVTVNFLRIPMGRMIESGIKGGVPDFEALRFQR